MCMLDLRVGSVEGTKRYPHQLLVEKEPWLAGELCTVCDRGPRPFVSNVSLGDRNEGAPPQLNHNCHNPY